MGSLFATFFSYGGYFFATIFPYGGFLLCFFHFVAFFYSGALSVMFFFMWAIFAMFFSIWEYFHGVGPFHYFFSLTKDLLFIFSLWEPFWACPHLTKNSADFTFSTNFPCPNFKIGDVKIF